jgi:hypothetical protein
VQSEGTDDQAGDELRRAVQTTLATGSARVRFTMDANPPELAEYHTGEGVADFRERRSRVAYSGRRTDDASGDAGPPLIEQVTDCDVTYLRVGDPSEEWVELEIGEPGEFSPTGDATGFLDLLISPASVGRMATQELIDGRPARGYTLTIGAPKSSLRDRMSRAIGVKGPSRFWLQAWTDAYDRVRRIVASDHAPNPDGTLPPGAVRTTIEYDDFSGPAPVDVPPTG